MTRSLISPADEDWRRFSASLVMAAALSFLLATAFLLAVDPYDTGRTGLLRRGGVPEQYPTTANASRGRNPAFDAAIVGNSRAQQLQPERLDRLTGLSFVSLAMPGSSPGDQLAVTRWFLRSHETLPRAVVLGMDAPWCASGHGNSARFPTWLYESSFLPYLVGLIRYRSFEAAAARIAMLRTGKNEARRDGYWDYTPHFEKAGLVDFEASRRRLANAHVTFLPNPGRRFPAIEALGALLREDVARATTFVLLRPPVYETGLPKTGTAEEDTMLSCADAVRRAAAGRLGTIVIDLLRPGPIASDPRNFFDYDHYRDTLAAEIESMIARELRDAGATRSAASSERRP